MPSIKLEEQLEEQPKDEKPITENCQEPLENANTNGGNLTKCVEGMDKELGSSTTTTMDLPCRHRKLPPELERQIYLCFNPATQRKFICGLGWNFYDMFRHKLLTKTKRVRNPHGNCWNGTNTKATVAANDLNVRNNDGVANIFAEQPFIISGQHCRLDGFPGTICYYYEITGGLYCIVGLAGGAISGPDNLRIGEFSNSYAIPTGYFYGCWLAGEYRQFKLPEGAIRPEGKAHGNVFGCGLVLDQEDRLAVFFTLNGKLRGRKIPISPTVGLFPAVSTKPNVSSFETNFGDDAAKPFEYDIQNCPGMELACI